jgi:hypothetical protein
MLMYLWMVAGFFLGTWSLNIISRMVGFSKINNSAIIVAGLIGVLTVYTIFMG